MFFYKKYTYCTSEQSSRGSNRKWILKPNLTYKPTFKNVPYHVKSDFSIFQSTCSSHIFVFWYLVFWSLVLQFSFRIFFCLAHLALQNVNKDYVIFLYFRNFVAKSDHKPKKGLTKQWAKKYCSISTKKLKNIVHFDPNLSFFWF